MLILEIIVILEMDIGLLLERCRERLPACVVLPDVVVTLGIGLSRDDENPDRLYCSGCLASDRFRGDYGASGED